MSFRRLLDELSAERNRRAYDRDVAMTVDRIRFGGRPFHKAMSTLTAMASDMAKAMRSDMVRARADQRRDAIVQLADFNTRATAAAASGQLSGEEGAKLDALIHKAALRIEAL